MRALAIASILLGSVVAHAEEVAPAVVAWRLAVHEAIKPKSRDLQTCWSMSHGALKELTVVLRLRYDGQRARATIGTRSQKKQFDACVLRVFQRTKLPGPPEGDLETMTLPIRFKASGS